MSAMKSKKKNTGGIGILQQSEDERDSKGNKERIHNMVVAVRIRPLSSREIDAGHSSCCHVVNGNIVAIRKEGNAAMYLRSQQGSVNEYCFDAAFDSNSSQLEIYEKTAKSFIPTLIEGYNVTVFAYGATGAGKTHTMMGSTRSDESRNASEAGIIPNALSDVFSLISTNQTHESWNICVSFMEVYNEQVFDLLEPTGKVLSVREDPERGVVIVAGLTQQQVTSTEHVLQLLVNGNKNRKTESTMANQVSSRSHAILQLIIKHHYLSSNGQETTVESVLSLIDLAGSERASATNNTGTRLQEGANINKSLLALANCINALASPPNSSQGGNKKPNVKYRDSKLTHLLKSSLEGRCHVIMIANINPSHHTFEDSHNTLKYANRAKNIKINPIISMETHALTTSCSSSSSSSCLSLSLTNLTQADVTQWMERENGLREENLELRIKINELNEIINEFKEIQKKTFLKCCTCGLNRNLIPEKAEDDQENVERNSCLPSPLPSKSPLRPNSSPLASKKSYSPHVNGSKHFQNSFTISSPDNFSSLESQYQYPSLQQLSEALEDPLCLSEDLQIDPKPTQSHGSRQLRSRIAELSVITQKQQELFQNILQDTEPTRRESLGIMKRRSSIATSNSNRLKLGDQNDKNDEKKSNWMSSSNQENPESGRKIPSKNRPMSLALGDQIYSDPNNGKEESKELDLEDIDLEESGNSKKRRFSLIPGGKNLQKPTTNILKERSLNQNISIFSDSHEKENEKIIKKQKIVVKDVGNENIPLTPALSLGLGAIPSTSSTPLSAENTKKLRRRSSIASTKRVASRVI